MPMKFTPKNDETNASNFDATPDCGAMVSLISLDLVAKYGLHVDSTNKVRMVAANSTMMSCEGTAEGSGQHRITKRSVDLELRVTHDLKNEILISYWDLVRLRVLGKSFPFTECPREMCEEQESYDIRLISTVRSNLRKLGSDMILAENRILEVREVAPEAALIKNALITEFRGTVSDTISDKPIKAPPVEIKLKDGPIRPIQVTRARPVEFHFQGKAYALLKDLEGKGIISLVSEPLGSARQNLCQSRTE